LHKTINRLAGGKSEKKYGTTLHIARMNASSKKYQFYFTWLRNAGVFCSVAYSVFTFEKRKMRRNIKVFTILNNNEIAHTVLVSL